MLLAALAIRMPRSSPAQSPTYVTVYSFHGSPDGGDPKAALVIGKNGALYDTTYGGGESTLGAIFELTKPAGEPWKETVLHSFNGSDGQYPESPRPSVARERFMAVRLGAGAWVPQG